MTGGGKQRPGAVTISGTCSRCSAAFSYVYEGAGRIRRNCQACLDAMALRGPRKVSFTCAECSGTFTYTSPGRGRRRLRCEPCNAIYLRATATERRSRVKEAGLCVQCGRKRYGATASLCKRCNAEALERAMLRRKEALSGERCGHCGKDMAKSEPGLRSYCSDSCSEAGRSALRQKRYNTLRSAGLCVRCCGIRGKSGTANFCRACADKMSERNRKAKRHA